MKILIVTEFYKSVKGGGEISCRRLYEKLKERGHDVDLLSSDRTSLIFRLFFLHGYLIKEIRKRNPDLVHFYGVTAKVKTSLPSITTINSPLLVHPTGYSSVGPLKYLVGCFRLIMLKSNFRKDDRLICLSTYVQDMMRYAGYENTVIIPSVI